MNVLTVAGKADSRVIVYPLLYALRKYGRVAVATDDAAYRRLYHGYDDIGEVSGVSVFVHPFLDVEALSTEVNNFSPEILICVTNGYVPEFTTHLLALTGYDRSFEGGNAFTKEQVAQGINVATAEADIIIPPAGFPRERIQEVFISTEPIKDKKRLSVCLKDNVLDYVLKCEEYKRLLKHGSREYITILQKIVCPFLIPNANEFPQIFGFKR